MRIADRGIDLTKSSQLKTGAADEGLNGLAFCPQCEKTEKMIHGHKQLVSVAARHN